MKEEVAGKYTPEVERSYPAKKDGTLVDPIAASPSQALPLIWGVGTGSNSRLSHKGGHHFLCGGMVSSLLRFLP